jgi:DMSO/TMAO reductase YedYZ molybdopterin-dependent catalytic subunit
MSWVRAIGASLLATSVAMGLMFWARAVFQVRTLPERVMEWLLLFVPLDTFEQGIRTFGPQAKVLALYGGIAVMSASLFGLGLLALRRRWPGPAILAMALILFIIAMAGIMPLTGGGFFGSSLLQHVLLVNGVYLGMSLVYASLLLLPQALEHLDAQSAASPDPAAVQASRRSLAAGLAGTSLAYAAALRQASIGGGRTGSDLPLAQVPPNTVGSSGSLAPTAPAATPTAHPGMAGIPAQATADTPEVAATVAAAAAPAIPTTAAAPAAQAAPTTPAQPTAPSPAPPADQDSPAAVPTTVTAAEPAPQPPTSPPTRPPQPTATAAPPAPRSTEPPPSSTVPAGPPNTTPLPTPRARELARDQGGALTASSRQKGELASLVTPTNAHYVVTKNAVTDPALDAETWRMVLDGEVARPVQVDYQTLRRLPAAEQYKTLECISNFTSMCHLAFFGCDLISTAQWKGARLRDVLELAGGLRPGVVSLLVRGADEFSSSIPASLASNPDVLLAYEMNGQVLPRQHGYPVRLLVPGRYGMKSAKWVVGIRALRTEQLDWYGQRNWSRTGIVRTMSRIDVPADGARLTPGRHRISGIAYAGDRGVSGVQFSSNGGQSWNPANFVEPPLGRDTWVRWTAEFDLAPGQALKLMSRAVDGQGQVQTEVFNLPQPDGGSGLHSIEIAAA